jgi:hypothetical protein
MRAALKAAKKSKLIMFPSKTIKPVPPDVPFEVIVAGLAADAALLKSSISA